MIKVNDPVAQRIHRENADHMCLASYVSGLSTNVGKIVRIQNPQTIQQALTIALAVTEAERQEKVVKSFSRDPTSLPTQRIGKTEIPNEFLTHARVEINHRIALQEGPKRGQP